MFLRYQIEVVFILPQNKKNKQVKNVENLLNFLACRQLWTGIRMTLVNNGGLDVFFRLQFIYDEFYTSSLNYT